MALIEYRRLKCDQCGRLKDLLENEKPRRTTYFRVTITRWKYNMGTDALQRDACSERCVLRILRSIRKIPKKKPRFRL